VGGSDEKVYLPGAVGWLDMARYYNQTTEELMKQPDCDLFLMWLVWSQRGLYGVL
jgi:hypothetical protein